MDSYSTQYKESSYDEVFFFIIRNIKGRKLEKKEQRERAENLKSNLANNTQYCTIVTFVLVYEMI